MRVGESVSETIYRCVGGSQVGSDGVCVEHGETACVIGVRMPVGRVDEADQATESDRARFRANSARHPD